MGLNEELKRRGILLEFVFRQKGTRAFEDAETYEEAVRKQAALAEQVRLKEQAAKGQVGRAKSIKNKSR